MTTMKILAIVPATFDTSPGQRFRLEQWEPILRQQGISITWSPFENDALHEVMGRPGNMHAKISGILRGFSQRFADVRRAKDFDAIYIFRESALLGPAFIERLLASTGVPMVFDFDDAVWVRYVSPAHGYLSYLKMPQKTGSIIASCAHVMAGNSYLAEYARPFNSDVTIIPTTIDTDKYQLPEGRKQQNSVPVIGWSGSFSTVQHLKTLRLALQQLAKMFSSNSASLVRQNMICPVSMWRFCRGGPPAKSKIYPSSISASCRCLTKIGRGANAASKPCSTWRWAYQRSVLPLA